MIQTNAVPFEPRPVDPKAWEALDRVVAATEAMRDAEAMRGQASERRARAIMEARSLGLSLDVIAQRLGVSRERVRQMAAKSADPVRANEEGPRPEPNRLKPLR